MAMNLLVEVFLHTTREKEISQETSGFHKERHAELLSTMLPKPERSPKKCGPIAWFRLPIASVQAWSSGSISLDGYSRSLPKRRKSNPLPPFGAGRETASLA